jgi:hypothetical protein
MRRAEKEKEMTRRETIIFTGGDRKYLNTTA